MTVPTLLAGIPAAGLYRIAAVSRLTRIPAQTLRVWEARHGVVQPERSAGNLRLYRRADIDRLLLLKAAVDAGHSIGTVAALTDPQIRTRIQDAPTALGPKPPTRCRVLVFGEALASVLKTSWQARSDVRLQGVLPSLPTGDFGSLPAVDAVIVDAPVAGPALPAALRPVLGATKAPVVIVVYGIGDRQALARLDAANIIALSSPTDPAQLARICQLAMAMETAPAPRLLPQRLMPPAAPPRYAEAFLRRLSHRPTDDACECPNHLADLLLKLSAFERYSLDCESLQPEDAALHALMYSASGQCRLLLEEALRQVVAQEDIEDHG